MTRLFPLQAWTAIFAVTAVLLVVIPVLHLAVPEASAFHVSSFWITLLGKFMCYAVVALAMDLIWGYTGILSLGQGLFFALGGYVFGMYLMRQIGRDGVYQSDLPDFMVFLDWKELPWYWTAQRLVRLDDAPRDCSARTASPSCSASSRSARASRACTSPSLRRH